MGVREHIQAQEAIVYQIMSDAAAAGGDVDDMEHVFGLLRTALEGINVGAPAVTEIVASGYLSAFLPEGNAERARSILPIIVMQVPGIDVTLKTILDRFEAMNGESKRLFGLAMARLHPTTLPQAVAGFGR